MSFPANSPYKLFGFNLNQVITNPVNDAPNRADITNGIDNILVHCDLIDDSNAFVNGRQSNLIYTIGAMTVLPGTYFNASAGPPGAPCGLRPDSDIPKPPAIGAVGPEGEGTAVAGSFSVGSFCPPSGEGGLPTSDAGSTGNSCGLIDGLSSAFDTSRPPAIEMDGPGRIG